MKRFLSLISSIMLALIAMPGHGQQCGNRKLDPEIAGFLKIIGYKDLTLEQLRSMPIGQLKYPQIH